MWMGWNPRHRLGSQFFRSGTKSEGPLATLQGWGAKYGLVILMHFLQHIEDLLTTLVSIRESLQADGLIFIEVPHQLGHPRFLLEENPSYEHFLSIERFSRMLAETDLELVSFRTKGAFSALFGHNLRISQKEEFQIRAAVDEGFGDVTDLVRALIGRHLGRSHTQSRGSRVLPLERRCCGAMRF